MKTRIIAAFAAVVVAVTLFAAPARADLTAANAHQDRAHFEACQNASNHRRDSQEAFAHAVRVCGVAGVHYAEEMKTVKNEDTVCLAGIYAGGVILQIAYIAHDSAVPEKATAYKHKGILILKFVADNCTDEPNIDRAAKSMISSEKVMSQAIGY